MNITLNYTQLNLSQPPGYHYTTIDPVALCAQYSQTMETLALFLVVLSIAAILWFGPRAWLSRHIENEHAKAAIGAALLVGIGILAALLQANISR